MEKTIVLDHISKQYKNNRGVLDISLDVSAGEIFGFLGPNGAGKTTAMKMMTGLLTPDQGDVFIQGFSVRNQYEKAMQHVGCLIEDVCAVPYMTAYENMKMCLRYYPNLSDAAIDESLELVGLLPYKKEKVRHFSLGMRQRLGIAMAIVSHPSVLILDEPLNGLDVEGMVEMRTLITRLAKEKGTTFFISSHLIHDVELTCSRVGIVHEGKLVAVKSMDEILENFATLENYYLSEVGESVGV